MANETEEIKQRLDIVELVREYVPQLKRVGANWKATCPFHQEKTPSFMVSEPKQIWHCFGCGRGGDHFAFIMEQEGVDFPEALRILAKRTGIQLKKRDPSLDSKRSRIAELLALAAKYYRKVLLESRAGEAGRTYLTDREVPEDVAETFQLGFAIESWDDVITFLTKRGYHERDLFDAGLVVKRDKGDGYYNRFRNRLMFPLVNVNGDVVGFGGRVLDPKTKEAKYINSPETLLYHKGSFVYGLAQAKDAIRQDRRAIIVEGYMDVLASHKAGVHNVVASGGTAMTPNQARLIKRYAETVILAFDADEAGEAAARRGVDVAWEAGLAVDVLAIPSGKDPDDLVRQDSDAWKAIVTTTKPFVDFYLERAQSTNDLTTLPGKQAATALLLPLIAKIPDGVAQTHYLQGLGKMINVEERVLREQMTRHDAPRPRQNAPAAAVPHPQQSSRFVQLAEYLLAIGLAHPNEHFAYIVDHLRPESMPSDALQDLYRIMIVQYTEHRASFAEKVAAEASSAPDDIKTLYRMIAVRSTELADDGSDRFQRDVVQSISDLKRVALHRELTRLERDMQAAEATNDTKRLSELSDRVQTVMNELADIP